MNKITTIIIAVIVLSGIAFGGIVEDMKDANALRVQGKYAEAQAAYEKAIADYPDADVNKLIYVQNRIGALLARQGKYAEARKACEKAIADYPDAGVSSRAVVQNKIGWLFAKQGKYAEAQAAYEKAIADYPDADGKRQVNIRRGLGKVLAAQGDKTGANTALVEAATEYGFVSLGTQKSIFGLIDWTALGKTAAKEYLNNLLLVVPATERNAQFLGQIKSKLELMQ